MSFRYSRRFAALSLSRAGYFANSTSFTLPLHSTRLGLLRVQSEKFIPTDGFPAALDYHGTSGPLHTTVHPLAPISEAILESYIDKGIAYKADMFVSGEGEGVGHVTRTVHDGYRTSGADFVNHDPPKNLSVLYNTTVTRVVLEPVEVEGVDGELSAQAKQEKYTAVGVETATLIPPTTNPDLSSLSLSDTPSSPSSPSPPLPQRYLKTRERSEKTKEKRREKERKDKRKRKERREELTSDSNSTDKN